MRIRVDEEEWYPVITFEDLGRYEIYVDEKMLKKYQKLFKDFTKMQNDLADILDAEINAVHLGE